jgi:chromosome segregation ATPase
MALNWLRRSKQKESKLKPKSKDDSLNEQVETLTLELTNSKREVAELFKKSEEYERTILKLRKESFELQTQNENITNEKEILKRAVKTLEQDIRKLKKKNARTNHKLSNSK